MSNLPAKQQQSATPTTVAQTAPPERLDAIEDLLTLIYDSANLPTPAPDLWQDKLRAYLVTLAPVPTTALLTSYQRATEAHKGPFAVTAFEVLAAWREVSRATFQTAQSPRPAPEYGVDERTDDEVAEPMVRHMAELEARGVYGLLESKTFWRDEYAGRYGAML
jgi:hypothetical protein